MSQDQQTYRRAVHAAALGLLVQAVLTLVVAVLGLYAQSPAVYAAAWYFAGGLGVWSILVVVYHQHRLERVEALEAEQFALTDAASTALFEQPGDELRVARRRLGYLYKWGLSLIGLLTAGYLIFVGLTLLSRQYEAYLAGTLLTGAVREGINTYVLLGVLLAVSFVAFIVARYESGMTGTPAWRLLRGGASYLMGNAVVAVLLCLGAFLVHYRNAAGLGYLRLLIPCVLVLVGSEMVVTLLLSAYRPRRVGEVARPAFDSRLLGLMANPGSLAQAVGEAINYQFGFEVSRSWFYQLMIRAVVPLVVFGVLTMVLISGVVVVAPYEQAVVTRFGRLHGETLGPGLHLKLPWPICRVEKHNVGRVHQVLVGSVHNPIDHDQAILWANQHADEEAYLIAASAPFVDRSVVIEGPATEVGVRGGGGGMSLVGAQLAVQYRITDLHQHLTTSQDGRRMLGAIAERRANTYFLSQDIDTLLASGRMALGHELRQQIQADADAAGLGLEVAFVGLNSLHPPAEAGVAAAFLEQIGAQQERASTLDRAHQEAIETLTAVAGSYDQALAIDQAIVGLQRLEQDRRDSHNPRQPLKAALQRDRVRALEIQIERLLTQARGQAARIIYEARADRWERAITERAMAQRFGAELQAYRSAPNYYRAKRYLDTLRRGLTPGVRKYILATEAATPPVFRIDLKDSRSTIDALLEDQP